MRRAKWLSIIQTKAFLHQFLCSYSTWTMCFVFSCIFKGSCVNYDLPTASQTFPLQINASSTAPQAKRTRKSAKIVFRSFLRQLKRKIFVLHTFLSITYSFAIFSEGKLERFPIKNYWNFLVTIGIRCSPFFCAKHNPFL